MVALTANLLTDPLVTKLRPPRLDGTVVPRPRLLDLLRESFDTPLTLVTAPAGYGKTTAVAAALAGFSGSWGWLSLDEHDNELPTFVEHVVGAIRTAFPDVGQTTLSLLRQPRLPSVDLLARTLANELAALSRGCLLILDEYDAVQNPIVHAMLDALLLHPASYLHLVVVSRARPGLALGRLRTHGHVAEIGAADLRFTRAETRVFLERSFGIAVTDEAAAALAERTEGWIAGLRLTALAFSEWSDPAAMARALDGAALRTVREYLQQEVLERQHEAVQEFLLVTALFDRFCAPLCEALLAHSPVAGRIQSLLEQLARESLFVNPLDGQGDWYRCHGLFRDVLRQVLEDRIDAHGRAALHGRASGWFAAQGLVEEAVDHALLAGDGGAAADLVEARAAQALDRERWPALERWLDRLPAELVRQRPRLLLARAWTLQLRARHAEIPALLEAAEARLQHAPDDDVRDVRAEIEVLRGLTQLAAGELRSGFDRALRGWHEAPRQQSYQRGEAAFVLSVAGHALGEGMRVANLLRAYHAPEPDMEPVYAVRVIAGLAYQYLGSGALPQCEEAVLRLLNLAAKHDLGLAASWGRYFLGLVRYEWDDLTGAEEQFRAALRDRLPAHIAPLKGSFFGLAATLEAQGRSDQAHEQMRELLETASATWSPELLAQIRSFQAHLALRRGEVAAAARWLPPIGAGPAFCAASTQEVPEVTLAWLRVASGTPDSLAEADDRLAALERAYTTWHDTRHLVQILALQALAAEAQGATERGLTALERAVALATPGRFVRTFADFGPPMAALVGQLAATGRGPAEYLSRLQMAFGPTTAAAGPSTEAVPLVEAEERRLEYRDDHQGGEKDERGANEDDEGGEARPACKSLVNAARRQLGTSL